MAGQLTDAQVAFYRDNGYLCPLPALDPEEVAEARAARRLRGDARR